jgi:hypothetical protein
LTTHLVFGCLTSYSIQKHTAETQSVAEDRKEFSRFLCGSLRRVRGLAEKNNFKII